MITKINYSILGKAIWDTVKIPVMVIGSAFGVVAIMFLGNKLIGALIVPLFALVAILIGISILIRMRYQQLMRDHEQEQQKILNILKR